MRYNEKTHINYNNHSDLDSVMFNYQNNADTTVNIQIFFLNFTQRFFTILIVADLADS